MQDNETPAAAATKRVPWNKGKLVGAKPPLRPKVDDALAIAEQIDV